MNTADSFIDCVQHLPPAPVVASQLLGMFSDPDRDVDRIVELIGLDPSLTAELLKRCNSSFFAGAEPAADTMEAVMRLGFYEVYCIVIALVGSRAMTMAPAECGLDSAALWRHSVLTAVAASTLAARVQMVEAAGFTAGLLHDVGKLVFAAVRSRDYATLVRAHGASGAELVTAEEATLGLSHASVGARLLARWGLPENVTAAVQFHHDPAAAAEPFQRLAAAVNMANAWTHQLANNLEAEPGELVSDPESLRLLGMTVEDVLPAVTAVQTAAQRIKGLLNFGA